MQFVYNDGGRAAAGYRGYAGDCVVRSVAIATETPYQQVYDELSKLKRRARSGSVSAREGVHTSREWFRRYMWERHGFAWIATMRIGQGCRVHLHDGELPEGRLVVRLSKHVTAVVDGVIHDNHNPQREEHRLERFPGWQFARVKSGQTITANGVASVSRRCVYGYWKRGG